MGKAPCYTALRVFGCACYPYLRPYAKNKFDPKSLCCVFLGYNDKYKGYRCLYPPTGKVYICRHVLFDERHFPYADQYQVYHTATDSSLLSAWQSNFIKDSPSPIESTHDESLSPPRPESPIELSSIVGFDVVSHHEVTNVFPSVDVVSDPLS